MKKTAIVKWNTESLDTIKNQLLFFNELYYDPYLYFLQKKLFKNITKLIKIESEIPNQIIATQEYLKKNNILKEFDFNSFRKNPNNFTGISEYQIKKIISEYKSYEKEHNYFLETYNETVELLEKNYSLGYLRYLRLLDDFEIFADSHLRISKAFLELGSKKQITPLVTNLKNYESDKKFTTISFILDKLPTPGNLVSLDEILDFRNENSRKYLALVNWINKISKDDLSYAELLEEYEYLNSELTHSISTFNQHKSLDKIEILIKLPLEIVENIIKINWSKIPGLIIDIKRNKLLNYEKEFTLSGREIAYIFSANEKFKK